MNITFKNKLNTPIARILISTVVMLVTSTHATAQKNTVLADNIVIVKKYVYADPESAAKTTQSFQTQCRNIKEALYAQSRDPSAAPTADENLSLDDVRKLNDITVTEYFRGSDYARYESGQQWHISYQNVEQDRLRETEIYCRIIPKKYTKGEIRTKNQIITFHQSGNEEGVVQIVDMRAVSFNMVRPPTLPKDLMPQKIRNSNIECLSRPDLPNCYLKDIPVHLGTKKVVIVESKLPAKGLNKMIDVFNDMEIPNIGAGFGDGRVLKAGDFNQIYENVSVGVGKEIPNSRFELPEFTRSYKIINKN